MANPLFYHATLRVDAAVRVEQDEQGRYQATIAVGATELPLQSNQNMLKQIVKRGTQPSDRYRLVLSPHTNMDATLRAPDLRLLRHHDDLSDAERSDLTVGFSALGQLVYVGRGEDHNIALRIYPNPGGSLRKPFTMSVGLEPFLFNTLPPPGYGLSVTGQFDDSCNKIVIVRTETVALPRTKPRPATRKPRPVSTSAQNKPVPQGADAPQGARAQHPDTTTEKAATRQQHDTPTDDVSKPKRRRVRISHDKS